MISEQIERLNTAMRETSDKLFYERYRAVRLCLEGNSFAEISDLLGRVRQTFSLYWHNYQIIVLLVWKWITLSGNRLISRRSSVVS
ncbi:helix-turn-helix domain-containing protein [Paenibacillus polymyxa]|uniref:helix-turn-helix domain-containing protein n=1 Tax=Paenibacillus polymyxa TaxID=1406 RepID=UPI00307FBE36